MTDGHILPIGSSSKAFTATGAVILADEGKVDLDTPLREYMPEFKLSDPEASVFATLRDLLCHRTGLPRHDLLWICWGEAKRDELVFKALPHLPASKPFRSVWQYQNFMYAASGCAIEKLAGKSWEDFIRERIFAPLAMGDSAFLTDDRVQDKPYSVLYKPDKDGKNRPCTPEKTQMIAPAGSIVSNARDMAKWLKFNLANGKAGDGTLIKKECFAELFKPNIPYELMPFEIPQVKRLGYGLGWFIDSYRGYTRIDHGGNISGATALVSLIPEKNIGVAVLSNANSSPITYAITNTVEDALLGVESETDWIAFFKEQFGIIKRQGEDATNKFYGTKVEGKPISHGLSEYVGKYAHPGYGELEVVANEGEDGCADSSVDSPVGETENLLSIKFHSIIAKLTHMHYDIFYAYIYEMPLPAFFKTGLDGGIESISIQFEPGIEEFILFKRVPKAGEM
jgi:CubicO group peptidase (beta-lactamase class C family)